jgi:hypothetical protein
LLSDAAASTVALAPPLPVAGAAGDAALDAVEDEDDELPLLPHAARARHEAAATTEYERLGIS